MRVFLLLLFLPLASAAQTVSIRSVSMGKEVVNGSRAVIVDVAITSTVTLVVDREGKPQQIRVIAPAGYGFDEAALQAVKQYRFKPATDASGAIVPVLV